MISETPITSIPASAIAFFVPPVEIISKPKLQKQNNSREYKSVDTGGAIRWIDGDTCRIDIFVPDARCIKDITSKYGNKIVEGKIYFKN